MAVTTDDPIVFNNLAIPSIIDLVSVGFGKGLFMQDRIVFNGTISKNPDYFTIVLAEDGVNDVSVQLDFTGCFQSYLVYRNNWIKDRGWGIEDVFGGFPFKAGETFILEFLVLPRDVISIYVNNRFFTYFRRLDLSKISQLYITDEQATLKINSLILYPNALKPTIATTEAPTTAPHCHKPIVLKNVPVPSTIDLVKNGFGKGFKPNTHIIFKGVPLQGANLFTINFVEDGVMFKTANAPFCFNPRLQSGVVVTNSWTVKSGWDVDHIYGNPFRVGEPFILEFRFEQYLQRDSISIYVNNKFLATYSYFGLKGYHDLKNVSHLYINGFRLDSLILCPNEYLSTTTGEPTYAIED